MIALYRPDQVRAMDQRAFARGVDSVALMERASGHLARAVLALAGRAYGLRVAVLCGKGNNGGDGIAAAGRLRAAGAQPRVCLVAGPDGLSDDGAEHLRRWRARGGTLVADVGTALEGADIAVDCLLGTGARGQPRSPLLEAVQALGASDVPVVACDLPSGVDADSGAVPGAAVSATVTVTLGAHKRGLWLWPARGHCGRLVCGDLDIVDDDQPAARVLEAPDVAELVGAASPEAHKRNRGVVLVFAGSRGMSGAATLVARGAMAAGAGLVTVATAAAVQPVVAASVPEVLTVALPDDPDGAFDVLAAEARRADALALGPGLGHDDPTVRLIRRLVAELDLPLVVDADGLNAFRHDGDALASHAAPVLVATPHAGEFARLIGRSASDAEEVAAERVSLVPQRAAAWNTVVVAKGPGSMVAAPDGRVWINPTGSAALATGGTGDVLTGVTATLVAQHPRAEAVAAAVWLHGRAGEHATMAGGWRAVTEPIPAARTARSVAALDVAAGLRSAFQELDAR